MYVCVRDVDALVLLLEKRREGVSEKVGEKGATRGLHTRRERKREMERKKGLLAIGEGKGGKSTATPCEAGE